MNARRYENFLARVSTARFNYNGRGKSSTGITRADQHVKRTSLVFLIRHRSGKEALDRFFKKNTDSSRTLIWLEAALIPSFFIKCGEKALSDGGEKALSDGGSSSREKRRQRYAGRLFRSFIFISAPHEGSLFSRRRSRTYLSIRASNDIRSSVGRFHPTRPHTNTPPTLIHT